MADVKNEQKQKAAAWFKALRDAICAEFEAIEQEYADKNPEVAATMGKFERTNWERPDLKENEGGGGTMSVMKGNVFEKVGVNISTVHGFFSEDFRKQIPGAAETGAFWASGISLVAHMKNPHVPAVHMNTRHIVTEKSWFGGGADLNPSHPNDADTKTFHAAFEKTCHAEDPSFHKTFKEKCDEYFYIPHRQKSRGVGGIFYDYLNRDNWEADFNFTQEVGKTFLDIYPKLVRQNMDKEWNEAEKEEQLIYRGHYAEFNLVYDRGTKFGLQTNGNTEAILMSLPPEAKWP